MIAENIVELILCNKVVHDLLKAGFNISVHDGEEITLRDSRDQEKIIAAMFSTDDDRLIVSKEAGEKVNGWVDFVYGNDGFDVIHDYTTNLESIIGPIMHLADRLAPDTGSRSEMMEVIMECLQVYEEPVPAAVVHENLLELPERCAARLGTTKQPIFIDRGHDGYTPAPNDLEPDAWNAERGITRPQVLAMEAGSMFGWGCPGANPKAYTKKPAEAKEPPEDDLGFTQQDVQAVIDNAAK